MQGDWNVQGGEDAYKNWKSTCGRFCNTETNESGLGLLELAGHNDLVLVNTLGKHKGSRRWTWHSPYGEHHNQIEYMVKRRFWTSVNTAETLSFPGADIRSDHDLVMMTFRLRLKKIKKQGPTRIKFDLEKFKDPGVAVAFQAMILGRSASLPSTLLDVDDTKVDTLISTFSTAVTETASEILGKNRAAKKPWVTTCILSL